MTKLPALYHMFQPPSGSAISLANATLFLMPFYLRMHAGRFHWEVLFIKDAIKTKYRVLLEFVVLFMNQVGCSRPQCL